MRKITHKQTQSKQNIIGIETNKRFVSSKVKITVPAGVSIGKAFTLTVVNPIFGFAPNDLLICESKFDREKIKPDTVVIITKDNGDYCVTANAEPDRIVGIVAHLYRKITTTLEESRMNNNAKTTRMTVSGKTYDALVKNAQQHHRTAPKQAEAILCEHLKTENCGLLEPVKNNLPELLEAVCTHEDCPDWLSGMIWDKLNDRSQFDAYSASYFRHMLENIAEQSEPQSHITSNNILDAEVLND